MGIGVETEERSSQSRKIESLDKETARLRARLELHGERLAPGQPEMRDQLLSASRRAATAGIRSYNDPIGTFRTENYLTQMIIAWNTLCQARLLRLGGEIFDAGPPLAGGVRKVREFTQLIGDALPDPEYRGVRENILFLYRLRGRIEHHFVPEIDLLVAEHVQAMLLNYEHLLVEEAGEVAALGNALTIPLYISELGAEGPPDSAVDLEGRLPPDVLKELTSLRAGVPDDVLEDPSFAVRIHLIATTANRESQAQRIVHFIDAATATQEQKELLEQLAVVTKVKHQAISGRGLLKPGAVANAVEAAIPWKFSASGHHARAWKYFSVRPLAGVGDPTKTDARYCVYDEPSGEYRYTRAWVRRLIDELAEAERFEEVTGSRPRPRA